MSLRAPSLLRFSQTTAEKNQKQKQYISNAFLKHSERTPHLIYPSKIHHLLLFVKTYFRPLICHIYFRRSAIFTSADLPSSSAGRADRPASRDWCRPSSSAGRADRPASRDGCRKSRQGELLLSAGFDRSDAGSPGALPRFAQGIIHDGFDRRCRLADLIELIIIHLDRDQALDTLRADHSRHGKGDAVYVKGTVHQ